MLELLIDNPAPAGLPTNGALLLYHCSNAKDFVRKMRTFDKWGTLPVGHEGPRENSVAVAPMLALQTAVVTHMPRTVPEAAPVDWTLPGAPESALKGLALPSAPEVTPHGPEGDPTGALSFTIIASMPPGGACPTLARLLRPSTSPTRVDSGAAAASPHGP